MSILIKGMEMPQGCASCPYCDRNWSKPKCHAKSAKGRYMAQKLFLNSRRQDWCPLVEVPKHGRLIDADALAKTIAEHVYPVADYFNSRDYGMFWTGGIEKAINEQSTIIEAEE